jgi:hypothetical protein
MLVAGTAVYLFGYFTWIAYAWRERLGPAAHLKDLIFVLTSYEISDRDFSTSNLNRAREFPPGRFFARFRAAIPGLTTGRRKKAANIMKPNHIFISILAVLFVFPLTGTFAQEASITIDVIATFDYPGTGNQTHPQKINDAGDIVGFYFDSSGVSRGFIRSRNGSFSAPIVEPNDTGNFTAGRGINNSRTVCGDYVGSDGAFHGFFLSGRTFTEFDIPDAFDTEVLGINNAGDFAGGFTPSTTGIAQAFVSIGGSIMPIDISGSTASFAYQLNASNQFVGFFADSVSITHGFYLDNNGTLRFPIDPPGSTGTILFGNNDRNWIVGKYSDSAGATHGLLFIPPNKFVVFDYPGSIFTLLNGINRNGFICGRYLDPSSGIEHGILARARRTVGNEAGMELKANRPALPVRATSPSSSALPSKGPAS